MLAVTVILIIIAGWINNFLIKRTHIYITREQQQKKEKNIQHP